MHYHVILTKECNLECDYCGGGSDSLPTEIQYSIDDLKAFISKDPQPIIEFYGGEPLLRIELMKRIMDELQAEFVIQTNGLLLHRLEPAYFKKFHSVLISIDGEKDVTDKGRGKGVHDIIMKNVAFIRKQKFNGDLVARMTVMQGTRIYDNVMYLLTINPGFDHVHWQLDFEIFWEAWEHTRSGLSEWIESYNSGISTLVDWWISEMRRTGRVYGIVPFKCIIKSLLDGTDSRLRCGSGVDFFTIMPDGRISACPVSIDYEFSVIGSIYDNVPRSLVDIAKIREPCTSCDIFRICGGRCLFVNRSQHMLRENGYAMICHTVKHLVKELREGLPEIKALLKEGAVPISEFQYPEFNNGCEVIP